MDLYTITKRKINVEEVNKLVEFFNNFDKCDFNHYFMMVLSEYYKYNDKSEENIIIEENLDFCLLNNEELSEYRNNIPSWDSDSDSWWENLNKKTDSIYNNLDEYNKEFINYLNK